MTDCSAVMSCLICLESPVMALNCVLVARLFFDIVVIVPVSVCIDFDLQGSLVVDGAFDDLCPAVFHGDHILIELVSKLCVEIFHLSLAAIVKAGWNWHGSHCHFKWWTTTHVDEIFVKFFFFLIMKAVQKSLLI